MHRFSTSFILGYHGCSQEAAERLLAGEPFTLSQNDYDWLGPGIYFWQANPRRALKFAEEKRIREEAAWKPAVLGAAIDLGLCLDLSTEAGVMQVKAAYDVLTRTFRAAEAELPTNYGGTDRLLRKLDCAVVRMLHDIRKSGGQEPVDTILGIFVEGEPIYENSGFHEKTHIQICVCNTDSIKGVFRVSPTNFIP